MSTINTNALDVNYPIPGVNNNSQGFRDNFASIKTNLNTAATEITDLQNKVVVKSALSGSSLNNDMANTIISNAATRSFRATTYNLGNSLSGTVLVDVSLGDVQYGTVAGNITFQFGNWAPTGTQSNVQLQLAISNAHRNSFISFPSEMVINENTGVTTLENFSNIAGVATVSIPYNISQIDYRISTVDCGNSLLVEPYNRPRIDTQIQNNRLVPPTGFRGDVPGTVVASPSMDQLPITISNAADYFTTTGNTIQLYTDMPITFSGTSCEANIAVGTTYYVRNVVSATTFSVSSTLGGANVNLTGNSSLTSTMYGNPINYVYICTDTYNSTSYLKNVSNTTVTTNAVTLDNITNLTVNAPIIFTANIGGIYANTVYYIKAISSPNITVSQSRTNGVADTVVTLSSNSTATTATVYVGNDIWKKIATTTW